MDYRQEVRREEEVCYYITCWAPIELFGEEKDMPQELQDELDARPGIPCEGNGVLDYWCRNCRWGEIEEE